MAQETEVNAAMPAGPMPAGRLTGRPVNEDIKLAYIRAGPRSDLKLTAGLKDAITLPAHFKANGYVTLGAGKLFHAHTFFDKKNLSGYPDPDAWVDYFPSPTQQMPEEVVPENWPVNSSRKFYAGHFDWSALQIPKSDNQRVEFCKAPF